MVRKDAVVFSISLNFDPPLKFYYPFTVRDDVDLNGLCADVCLRPVVLGPVGLLAKVQLGHDVTTAVLAAAVLADGSAAAVLAAVATPLHIGGFNLSCCS